MITVNARAKVNLTLEVLGKRADGYHEIVSVLQTIDLADRLSFESGDELVFECRDPIVRRADLMGRSLVRTGELLRRQTACRKGAVIRLEALHIPRAAGLGSSSADCAAVLRGLNELWGVGLSDEDLSRLASELGSDTPFLVRGGTALAEGRGEKVSSLPALRPTRLVLLTPPIESPVHKTAQMYRALDPAAYSSGEAAQRLVSHIRQGRPLRPELIHNAFETLAFERVGEFAGHLLAAGAGRVHLAGSGPTLFALAGDEVRGQAIVNRLKERGIPSLLVTTV